MTQNVTEHKTEGTEAENQSQLVIVDVPGSDPVVVEAERVRHTSSKTIIWMVESESDMIDIVVREGVVESRSLAARAALTSRSGAGTESREDRHTDGEGRVMTDGGRDVIEPGDYVTYEYPAVNVPDLWQVTEVRHNDRVNVDDFADGEPAPLNDVPAHTVYDLRTQDGDHHKSSAHEDDVERAQTGAMDIENEDDDPELVTDGGVPTCGTCAVSHCNDPRPCMRCQDQWGDALWEHIDGLGQGAVVECDGDELVVMGLSHGPTAKLGERVEIDGQTGVLPVRDVDIRDVTVIEEAR